MFLNKCVKNVLDFGWRPVLITVDVSQPTVDTSFYSHKCIILSSLFYDCFSAVMKITL